MDSPESEIPCSHAPAEAINVTDDGSVRKKVVHEGRGEVPELHSKCLGEYLLDWRIPWRRPPILTLPLGAHVC